MEGEPSLFFFLNFFLAHVYVMCIPSGPNVTCMSLKNNFLAENFPKSFFSPGFSLVLLVSLVLYWQFWWYIQTIKTQHSFVFVVCLSSSSSNFAKEEITYYVFPPFLFFMRLWICMYKSWHFISTLLQDLFITIRTISMLSLFYK